MASKWDVNMAVRTSGLPAPSRLIMLTLADIADAKTAVIPEERGPSLREIAEWTGLGKASVARHLTILEESGWIVRDRPDINDARREHARTGYRLTVGHVSEEDMPMSQSETSQNGHVGSGMSQSETEHVPERDKGMSQGETVPYTDEVTNDKTSSTSENTAKPKPRPSKQKSPPDRPDVERICQHLADRIEANGSNRPTVTAKWRTEARLLLDRDGKTVEQVMRAIDWCQADHFWRGNILSMPKLRKQYETLRLHAQRPNGRASPRPQNLVEHNGMHLKPETLADIQRTQRFAALDEQDASQQPAIGGPT